MSKILTIIILVLILGISFKLITNIKQGNEVMISPERVKEKIDEEESFVLLDVRTKEENEQERIPGSVLIPLDQIEKNAEAVLTDKNAEIIVYCRSGSRSNTAARILGNMGYTNVRDLGGILSWPYEVE